MVAVIVHLLKTHIFPQKLTPMGADGGRHFDDEGIAEVVVS